MKKLISILLIIALTASISVAGTVAYLKDDASDVNVMTLGNVKIEQIEQERDANGNLVDFTQAKPAYPAVGSIEWATEGVDVNGTEYKVFTNDLKNVVDKIVTVKNTGLSDAYVRTLVAIEAPGYDTQDWIHINTNSDGLDQEVLNVEINGEEYVVFGFTYSAALKPGAVSAPSLMQVFLDSAADNDYCAAFGNTWEIKVLSQAIQTQGFANAATALNTGYGELNAANVAAWFGDMETPTLVSNAEELKAALAAGDKIVLGADIDLVEAAAVAEEVDIDLNGYTLTTVGLELKNGGSIENGTIVSGGNTNMVPHLKVSGGIFEMNDVTVDVQHTVNANVNWTEATGMEIMNATATLNDCTVKIHNGTNAQWTYSYGISTNNATVTVNGGSITASCVPGTAANGPTNPNAISTMGACTVTLNDVDVDATYYATTVNGHLTLNTTDKTVTSDNIVDNRGGSHTLNYVD